MPVEEMLTGVQLWGLEFVASRMPVRTINAPEQTAWQIYASEDGTVVTIDADPEVADKPIAVMSYITRPAGAQVELDGVLVDDTAFIPVGNGDYEVARVLTPDGVHVVDGLGDPVSVTVVGFDSYDSYAYLGGVGTSVINPNPQG